MAVLMLAAILYVRGLLVEYEAARPERQAELAIGQLAQESKESGYWEKFNLPEVDDATKAALGLSSDPVVRNGRLEIECSKVGSGKIVLSGTVGKDTEKEDGIGEMAYSRTISVASRPFAANNGGWL